MQPHPCFTHLCTFHSCFLLLASARPTTWQDRQQECLKHLYRRTKQKTKIRFKISNTKQHQPLVNLQSGVVRTCNGRVPPSRASLPSDITSGAAASCPPLGRCTQRHRMQRGRIPLSLCMRHSWIDYHSSHNLPAFQCARNRTTNIEIVANQRLQPQKENQEQNHNRLVLPNSPKEFVIPELAAMERSNRPSKALTAVTTAGIVVALGAAGAVLYARSRRTTWAAALMSPQARSGSTKTPAGEVGNSTEDRTVEKQNGAPRAEEIEKQEDGASTNKQPCDGCDCGLNGGSEPPGPLEGTMHTYERHVIICRLVGVDGPRYSKFHVQQGQQLDVYDSRTYLHIFRVCLQNFGVTALPRRHFADL